MDIGKLTLEQKIIQTEIVLMEKKGKIKVCPGRSIFL